MPTSPTIPGWAPATSTTSSSPRPASTKGQLVAPVLLHQPSDGHRRHRLRAGRAPTCSWRGSTSRCLKLIEQGDVNETLMAMIRANTRLPIDTEGDTYSLAACNDVGCQRLVEMMDEFEHRRPRSRSSEHICAARREAVLAEIAKLPKGAWSQRHDRRRLSTRRSRSRRRSPITDEGIHVDYTGTSAAVALRHQRAARLHHRLHRVRARLRGRQRASPTTPARSRRSPCRRPRAAILNAPKPAAGVHPPRHRPDAARRGVPAACAQAIPERVPAEGTSCLWNLNVRGADARAARGGNYGFTMARDVATAAPARGAPSRRPVGHRLSQSGVKGTPVEIAESQHAADLLEEGAASRLRRRGPHPRRPRPDHRDRERHRTSPSSCSPPSTASTTRARRGGGKPGAPAWSRSRAAPRWGKGTQVVRARRAPRRL